MTPPAISVAELSAVLPPGGLTLVSGCSAESALLAQAVEHAGDALGAMTFSGIFVGGLNRRRWRAGRQSRTLTFFLTPELREEGGRVDFLPLCYQDIAREYRRRRPAAALFMCAPPDERGMCSFGTEVSFIADLWRDIPIRIAHINPLMPRTRGDHGIPVAELSAVIEQEEILRTTTTGAEDEVSAAIGRHVAEYIEDGATLQAGLGKIPDAVMRVLHDRRDLSLHSGLMGDGMLELLDAGAVTRPGAAIVGVAIGSDRLYRSLDHPALSFHPPSITHAPGVLAAISNLVTINSALEVDLFGQAHAELTPRGLMSGPGGASDYARGARGHGIRIVALPATAKSVSRIVGAGQGAGPVSLGRMDIDVVVTQYGAADLRGLGHGQRAAALIAIAAPEHREDLARGWRDASSRF